MISILDAQIVEELSTIFKLPADRIIWGRLEVAARIWAEVLSHKSSDPKQEGIAALPYMAFYRTIGYLDSNKLAGNIEVIDYDGVPKKFDFMPCVCNYTIEIMTSRVSDQTQLFKNYMFWTGKRNQVDINDGAVDWKFRVMPTEPEDNSDLVAEEDLGRIVRSTFTFGVETMLLDRGGVAEPILDILANVWGYYQDISESYKLFEVSIKEP